MWKRIALAAVLLSMVAAGCGASAQETVGGGVTAPAPTPTLAPGTVACSVAPVAQPVMPETIPGYTEIDPATGLHMTGTPLLIDLRSWRLEVTGKVERPLSLTYDYLRCLPSMEVAAKMICPGYFVDNATWRGTPIGEVLGLAGIREGASEIRLIAADGYSSWVDLSDEVLAGGFLAYEFDGEALPVLHGFPVRAVFPGKDGNTWVKWLVGIEVG
jgi:DMSO/TMAO reductase YedYZ molybdopterin-dependent catalytic subunit